MINGVSASQVYLPQLDNHPTSIYEYLINQFPHINQVEWQQRFKNQLIIDEAGNYLTIQTPYIAGTHVYYYRFLDHEVHVPFYEKILFENEHLLVVDKPHFLTISPSGQYLQETLLVRLKKATNNPDLTPIHRLDRETAGVVLISKKPETRGVYQQMFAERKVHKIYEAIAPYRPELNFPLTVEVCMQKGQPFYTMQITEGKVNSKTEINLIEHNQMWGRYLLKPETGKQHQLRVHLNHLGIAIKNDPFYPKVQHKKNDDFSQPLQLLAREISFFDPVTFNQMSFCSDQKLTL